ncbi:MAG: hypothetical protein WC028_24075 [Candidatus Obscuribacterales bacterium]
MIKAIKNRLDRYLAWPAKRFFIVYASVAVVFALYSGLTVALPGASAPEMTLGTRLGVACLLSLVTLFAAAIFYLEIAYLYRVILEVIAGLKKLRAWLPGAITRTKAGLLSAGQAIAAAFRFLRGLPAETLPMIQRLLQRLRLPTGGELFFALMMASGFAIAGLIGYLFWPLASKIALGMPTWLPGSATDSSDFFEILLVDVALSCLPYAIALSLWSTLIIAVARRCKSKK